MRFGLTNVKTGGVVSRTVTVNVFVDVFPAASVAVTVTYVVPIGKNEPGGIEYVSVDRPTASVAVAVYAETIAPPRVLPSTVMFGAVITGGVVSRTTTVT